MFRAASEPPTEEMASTCGWSIRASTVSLAPCTTLKTPSGKPASEKRSARRMAESGVRWEGLRIKALPVAIARGANHSGIIMGKLNGVTAATTPGLTPSRASPFISVVIEAASSTTSMPRQISPFDSSTCLPFSRVQSSASSSRCSSSKTCSLNIRLALRVTGSSRHSSKALAATCTARSTSSAPESGTRPKSSPVAGSGTSSSSPASTATGPPPTKFLSTSIARTPPSRLPLLLSPLAVSYRDPRVSRKTGDLRATRCIGRPPKRGLQDARIRGECLVVLLELRPGFLEGELRVPGDVDRQVVLLWHAVLALDGARLLDAAEDLLEPLKRDAHGDHNLPRALSRSPEIVAVVPADNLW